MGLYGAGPEAAAKLLYSLRLQTAWYGRPLRAVCAHFQSDRKVRFNVYWGLCNGW